MKRAQFVITRHFHLQLRRNSALKASNDIFYLHLSSQNKLALKFLNKNILRCQLARAHVSIHCSRMYTVCKIIRFETPSALAGTLTVQMPVTPSYLALNYLIKFAFLRLC